MNLRHLSSDCAGLLRRLNGFDPAYELIEGNDESLCSAFAQFSAHMLVHSRMYSSATAMYVAAWPAAANAQQLKVSLQRLVRIALPALVPVIREVRRRFAREFDYEREAADMADIRAAMGRAFGSRVRAAQLLARNWSDAKRASARSNAAPWRRSCAAASASTSAWSSRSGASSASAAAMTDIG